MVFELKGSSSPPGRSLLDLADQTRVRQHHVMPIEVFESKFPALITEYGYRQDSAGPGKWRGGNGIIREYQMTTDTELSLWFERSGNPAWGLFGGKDGAPPEVVINQGTPRETRRLKTNRMPLREGDTVRCYTGGGGRYSDPRERDPGGYPTQEDPPRCGIRIGTEGSPSMRRSIPAATGGGSDDASGPGYEPDEHDRVSADPSEGHRRVAGKDLVPVAHEVPGRHSRDERCSDYLIFAVQCLD